MQRKWILGLFGLLGCLLPALPMRADRPAGAPAAPKASAPARPGIDPIEAALHAGTAFRDVAIARDGRRVAWVEALHGLDGRPSGKMALRTAALASPASAGTAPAKTIDLPGTAAASPAFSPDGRRLAFLADDGRTPQLQVWLADLSPSGTEGKKGRATVPPLRRLTSFSGQLADLRWLPDGASLSALAIEGRMEAAGPLAARPRDEGLVGAHPDVQRIARFDAATGALVWASPADLYVYEYDASPDSSAFVATAARGEGDAKWWVAKLWRFGVDAPAGRVLHETKLQMAMPRWSPDGRTLAWIEGLMSDAGSTGGDVWTLPADAPPAGAESAQLPAARNATPGLASSPAWLAWAGPDQLLWVENVAGSTGISTVDLSTGKIESRWRAAEVLTGRGGALSLALAADGKTSAAIRHSFQHPPEIWAGEIGAWQQITKRNAEVHPLWSEPKDLRWTNDGLSIQGWLLSPAHPEPGKRLPLVVLIHGGPSAAHLPGWPTMAGVLAEAGFYVLMPNPRGSFGFGTAFQAANFKDFGYGDFRDIELGIDAAVASAPKEAPIDPARVGIFGWSYGGYMVMWAVAKSDRFAAAVAGAGIANWQSYAGQNRIDEWLVPFFGATIEDDPWIYARSSPITFISHAKTPTLILHGERDSEVPAPQGYEFWKALRRLGVPSELYIFADQGHRLNPAGERERYNRTVNWFQRWLVEPAELLAIVRKSDASVDLVDPSTGRSRATLPTGNGPHEAAISPDGATLVVSDYGTRAEPGSSLTVIDLATRRVVSKVDLGEHKKPHGLAWLGSQYLAVTAEGSGELLIVKPREGQVVRAVPTGQEISHMVAVTPEGNRAFVANIGSGSVTVIDLQTGQKVKDIPTGAGAEGIAFRPETREVWVTNREADTLSVIDADRLTVIATVPCPGFPIRIAFSARGRRALVTATRSGEVVAIDPEAKRETIRKKLDLSVVAEAKDRLFGDRFTASPAPVGLLFAPSGRRAYVAATQSDRVIEIDTESLDVVRVIETGREPDGMAVR
ncbi:MAG TPA: alpha/beta fold hydrolase [Thermoanaerobaculia bacterium]|jgi:YVTN family beta-propeller protein|nr:alpha/beta fold hydrolase [Thermoanaerobaculia bacterium]